MKGGPPRKIHIGCSGWHYDHWRGLFYPTGLAKTQWLQFYARQFDTVELNSSFYHLPSEKTFANWRDSASDSFVFAVKVSRFVTHIKRLRNLGSAMDKFLTHAASLKEKLGPFLYQLPPNMKRSDELLRSFVSTLPPAHKHVFEFRHQSWIDYSIFRMLQEYQAGLCISDMPGLSCPVIATADFAYIRLHGSTTLYSSCYSNEALSLWASRITQLAREVKTVYIYFNNDAEAFAVSNALSLSKLISDASVSEPRPE
jgi:uncharacterized protein YecE (DUF72 family)